MDDIDLSLDTEIGNVLGNLDGDITEHLNEKNITNLKKEMLDKLPLDDKMYKKFFNELKDYKFVDEIDELKLGCYYKWINLKSILEYDNIKITNGGFLYGYDLSCDNNNIILKFHKGTSRSQRGRYGKLRCTKISLNKAMFFQRLTDQEKIIIKILNYINERE